jgi:hypothetical protein
MEIFAKGEWCSSRAEFQRVPGFAGKGAFADRHPQVIGADPARIYSGELHSAIRHRSFVDDIVFIVAIQSIYTISF